MQKLLGEIDVLTDLKEQNGEKNNSQLLGKFCGLQCWIKWMSGLIFCDHNMRMCNNCNNIWFRFQEPSTHTYCDLTGKCSSVADPKTQETVSKYK